MPTIRYASSGFTSTFGSKLKGAKLKEDFTWSEIVWAATTLGKAREHQKNHGKYSVHEANYRALIIRANLRTLKNGELGKTGAYQSLDPSEKGAVSYYIGMTMLRLLAYRLLNVKWLLHLDLYKKQFDAQVDGKSRPDFIGLNKSDDWLVFESKGRSEKVSGEVFKKLSDGAKEQAKRLSKVGGRRPIASVAAITHYQGKAIRVVMRDPVPEEHGLTLALSKEQFIQQYYCAARSRATVSGSRDFQRSGRRFRGVEFSSLRVTIGLETDLLHERNERNLIAASGVEEVRTPLEFVGSDGTFVRLGNNWSEENMMLEPQDRA